MIPWPDIKVITFDCYGTLINWEEGILGSLIPLLRMHDVAVSDAEILALYARLERDAEQPPFRDYKTVLRNVVEGFAREFTFSLASEEMDLLVHSLPRWMPFPDTVESLAALKTRTKLAVISNTDDDLFSFTHQRLGIRFDWVITAEQVRSYKPSLHNFRAALQRMGLPTGQVVHVAQSLYHDIAPANRLGMHCVWVNRREGKEGTGATPTGEAFPDVVVPDLRSLVAMAGL